MRVVALRTLDDGLPLRALPLRVLGIVCEGGILIHQGYFAGLTSDKPALLHAESLSSSGISDVVAVILSDNQWSLLSRHPLPKMP